MSTLSQDAVNLLSDDYLISEGQIPNRFKLNKYGRTTNADSDTLTDIHDGANTTDDQAIWLPPTAARTHQLVSTELGDDLAGQGLRTLRIWGLPTWDTCQTYEDIIMDGTTDVPTVNQYVIIHRMKALTWGTSGPNVGVITATADEDDTVTAQINAGQGQTQMAIYGISSKCQLLINDFYVTVLRANLSTNEAHVDVQAVYNPIPQLISTKYLVKYTGSAGTRASSPARHVYKPPNVFDGPGILKLQATASANNLDVSGGFNGVLRVTG